MMYSNRILWLLLFVSCVCPKAIGQSLCAGIEVGSKGVKLCILDNQSSNIDVASKVVFDTTINTNAIKFSGQSHDATLMAVVTLFEIARKNYSIPSSQIFLAISSGVKQTAEKELKRENLNLLKESIGMVVRDKNGEVDVISVQDESIFSHKSLVPDQEKMTTIVIDIGSGNTKGGYYITSQVFNTFHIPWGTKTTAMAAEKMCDSPCFIDNFQKVLDKNLLHISKKDIPEAIDKCQITSFDFKILFSGGIVWATAVLAKPEFISANQIELSIHELEKLYSDLLRDYNYVMTLETHNTAYQQEREKILKVFDQKSIISGCGLLLKIMRKFERGTKGKKFYLVKNNKSGWLPGFLLDKMEVKTEGINSYSPR